MVEGKFEPPVVHWPANLAATADPAGLEAPKAAEIVKNPAVTPIPQQIVQTASQKKI